MTATERYTFECQIIHQAFRRVEKTREAGNRGDHLEAKNYLRLCRIAHQAARRAW
jgi:hypothetical protein